MAVTNHPEDAVVARTELALGAARGWRLLSDTNSLVWTVTVGDAQWVVKVLTDHTSDAELEHDLLGRLDEGRARQIATVEQLEGGQSLVLMPYLEGVVLADHLAAVPPDEALARRWAADLTALVGAVASLPLEGAGFGRRRYGAAPSHGRWSDFLAAYLEEQRHKGPRTAAIGYERLRDLLQTLAPRLDAACPRPSVVPADLNARNLLVTSQGRLVLLNMPVVWQGDPWAALGELLLHTDGTSIAEALAAAHHPEWLLHFYAAYHAFVICAYVERFSTEPFDRVPPWGRSRPLAELFREHLELAGTRS